MSIFLFFKFRNVYISGKKLPHFLEKFNAHEMNKKLEEKRSEQAKLFRQKIARVRQKFNLMTKRQKYIS